MSILQVNLGTYANDGTGDDLRTAFEKANANFSELDLTRVITADNLGSGAPIFKEKVGNNLKLRTITQGLNITVAYTDNEISIATPDSINAVEEDTDPRLGGNLNLNSFDILGSGNIFISGDIAAQNITATVVTGNLTGNVTGNLTGDVTGNVTGNVTGVITGLEGSTLIGNVIGTVSNIGDHSITELFDVSNQTPLVNQTLLWSGSAWTPGTITMGVSKIIAGTNISISPSNGLGDVTISSTATGSGGDLDFGSFSAPAGFSLDLGLF